MNSEALAVATLAVEGLAEAGKMILISMYDISYISKFQVNPHICFITFL
jgi:hypothetical protein